MNVRRILITSDDGYDSIGVKLLVRELKKDYEVKIAGTAKQMSGVGGRMTFPGGTWEMKEVDGCEAICVEGTPVDAVATAYSVWGRSFDIILSGINWGMNFGASLFNSGTFAAVYYALNSGFVTRGIAMSWDLEPQYIFYRHDGDEELEKKFHDYPGMTAKQVFELALVHDMWQAPILNINFPRKAAREMVMTKPITDIGTFYKLPLSSENGEFRYPDAYADEMEKREEYDAGALQAGKVSITPCRADMLDREVWEKVKGVRVELEG